MAPDGLDPSYEMLPIVDEPMGTDLLFQTRDQTNSHRWWVLYDVEKLHQDPSLRVTSCTVCILVSLNTIDLEFITSRDTRWVSFQHTEIAMLSPPYSADSQSEVGSPRPRRQVIQVDKYKHPGAVRVRKGPPRQRVKASHQKVKTGCLRCKYVSSQILS